MLSSPPSLHPDFLKCQDATTILVPPKLLSPPSNKQYKIFALKKARFYLTLCASCAKSVPRCRTVGPDQILDWSPYPGCQPKIGVPQLDAPHDCVVSGRFPHALPVRCLLVVPFDGAPVKQHPRTCLPKLVPPTGSSRPARPEKA
jgi:hypothetical protein